MEKYDNLGLVGEGSYGIVMKCRHKATGTLVAIKKFLESEDDRIVKRIANREIKMLKQLRHENLVSLIDVFRRRKKLYLVFEFVDYTLLDDLEKNPGGLEDKYARRILFQVLRGIEFCHKNDIIHRDVKPENILVSKSGIVKLCDFGFARPIAGQAKSFTDYVATRWYRAPELLVGDTRYGKPVDVWAVGCLTSEMFTGDPLFPGDSDIDQIYHIVRCIGPICSKHVEIFRHNSLFKGLHIPQASAMNSIDKRYPKLSKNVINFILRCLDPTPEARPSCTALLKFELFDDKLSESLIQEIKLKVHKEQERNPLLKNLQPASSTPTLKSNNSERIMPKNTSKVIIPPQKGVLNYKLKQDLPTKSTPISMPLNSGGNHDLSIVPTNIISNNNEEELSNTNSKPSTTDDDGWENVRPLTSRKERVASRAGRTAKKEKEIENKTRNSSPNKQMDSKSPSVGQEVTHTTDTIEAINNHQELTNKSVAIKPNTNAFTLMKSNETMPATSKLTNDNKSPSFETRSSPVSSEISISQTSHNFSTNTTNKKVAPSVSNPTIPVSTTTSLATTNNIIKSNIAGTYNSNATHLMPYHHHHLLLQHHSPHQTQQSPPQYFSNSLLFNSNYITKPIPNALSQRNNQTNNLSSNTNSSDHSYFPNIVKDSTRVRQNNFALPTMSMPSKSIAPSNNSNSTLNNNTNGLFKNSNYLTGERNGVYIKKKPIVNSRSIPIGYHDSNINNSSLGINNFNNTNNNNNNNNNITSGFIMLPELKGAEMQIIRNQGPSSNLKFKYVTPKSNFNSNENQNNPKNMDNLMTREP